jgi:hypothetical protein
VGWPRLVVERGAGYALTMETVQAPDLSKSFPRRGRDLLGGYAWLARLADKARAKHAGTDGDYVAYCPLSTGFLQRAGVHASDFGRAATSRRRERICLERNGLAPRPTGRRGACGITIINIM